MASGCRPWHLCPSLPPLNLRGVEYRVKKKNKKREQAPKSGNVLTFRLDTNGHEMVLHVLPDIFNSPGIPHVAKVLLFSLYLVIHWGAGRIQVRSGLSTSFTPIARSTANTAVCAPTRLFGLGFRGPRWERRERGEGQYRTCPAVHEPSPTNQLG